MIKAELSKQLMIRLTKKNQEKRIAIKPTSLSKELEIQKKWKPYKQKILQTQFYMQSSLHLM